MAYTINACTTVSVPSTPRQKSSSQAPFEARLKATLEHASRLTEMHGTTAIDTTIAWETVEELLKSHPYFSALVVPNWNLEKQSGSE